MLKRTMSLFIAASCVILLLPMHQAQAAGDYVHIVSVTPDTISDFSSDQEFTIVVDYSLQSAAKGIVYLGFNMEKVDSYALAGGANVEKGSDTITFNAVLTPVDWGEQPFKVYANLSEDPHPKSWNPLANDYFSLKKPLSVNKSDDGKFNQWNSAYAVFLQSGDYLKTGEYVRDVKNDSTPIAFALHDIDANGTPELLIYDGSDDHAGEGVYVYTFADEVERIGWLKGGGIDDGPVRIAQDRSVPGIFCSSGGTGYYEDNYYTIKQGEWHQELIEFTEYDPIYTNDEFIDTRVTKDETLYDANRRTENLDFYTLNEFLAKLSSMPSMPLTDTKTEPVTIFYDDSYDNGEIIVDWGASLFSQSAKEYNSDLALVAAALSTAADGNGAYLSSAYSALGFDERRYYNYTSSQTLPGSTTNEHCFSIASRKMVIDGKEQFVIAVILRGTHPDSSEERDGDIHAKADRDFGDYKVFNYFLDYANKVWNAFDAFLKENAVSYDSDIKLLISGHSLGGTAANLFAARFKISNSSIGTDNIYAFTFGALNSIGFFENSFSKDMWEEFQYINNIINYYDSFGPHGRGADGFGFARPAWGAYTLNGKFGRIMVFEKDYAKKGEWPYQNKSGRYITHVMPSYLLAIAIREDIFTGKSHSISILCPVDVEVYDSKNTLVGRIKNNVLDESVTILPMNVEGDKKFLLLPTNTQYSLRFTAFDEGEMNYYIETVGEIDAIASIQKSFENITLTIGKTMSSQVGGDADTSLVVINEVGTPIAEVQVDGTEIPVSTAGMGDVFQRLMNKIDRDALFIIMLFIAIVALCSAIAVALIRYRKKREYANQTIENNDALPDKSSIILCEKCGSQLPCKASFCAYCGERLG